MSSIDSQSTAASSEVHPMASAFAAFMSAQMKTFFEQHGIPEGHERHILASDTSVLVLKELSPDTPKSTSDEELDSAAAEASPTADPAAEVSAVATSRDSASEAASPTPSDSRSRSARIVAAHQAAIAHADESATIVVTASATGHGTHTRWSYADDPVVVAARLPAATEEELTDTPTANPSPPVETSTSDGGATLVGSSGDESAPQAQKEEAEAEAAASDSPKGKPTIIIPPSKKRVRIEEPPEAAGSSRRMRSRLSSPPPRTSVPRHTVPRDSRAPSPPPIPSHRSSSSSAPFNHFPKLPRSRPQGLRREPAFYHKSHYEVAWTSAFGDYDSPPKTVAEAMPEWLGRAPSPAPALTQAPTPAPSPPRAVSKKRARDEEAGKGETGKGEKRPRRSSLHESK